ncbi:MFS transporter [Paenibacillus sp. N1-5-1-14]|uniref:MFS transporter n=1 Tax=Paenibacillus radicibacter TaxID=2972488 RepID=UPI002158AC8C|nr:MFS transporter [Paenibacillus radicibacter]MCR8642456.1 MFS transporter [Paenibacillus radicibacter]
MLFRNKSFLVLMIGELVGGIGLWLSIIGNLQFMKHLVSSDFLKSLILMVGLLASVVLLPLIGRWIDSTNKKTVLLTANFVRVLSPLCMFPALMLDSIPWMIASLVLMQVSGAAYFPSVRTTIPLLIQKDQLLSANTIHMNITTISRIAGTAVAGVMVAQLSLMTNYVSAFIVFVILFGLNCLIQIPKQTEDPVVKASGPKEKMRFSEVFTLIKTERAVLVGLVSAGMLNFFFGGFNLLILSFSEVQQSDLIMGLVYTVEGVSILIAGFFVKKVIGKTNLVLGSSLLLLVFAVSQFFMSFAHSAVSVLGGFVIFGFAVAFFFPMVTTIFQRQIPSHMQGRFFSFKEMIDRVLMQLALLATGAILDLFGTPWYLYIMMILSLIIGVFTTFETKRHKLDVRQNETNAARKPAGEKAAVTG